MMPKAEIWYSESGKKAEIEFWAIRQGSRAEIEESAQGLLASLRDESGYKKASVFVGDKRIKRTTKPEDFDATEPEPIPEPIPEPTPEPIPEPVVKSKPISVEPVKVGKVVKVVSPVSPKKLSVRDRIQNKTEMKVCEGCSKKTIILKTAKRHGEYYGLRLCIQCFYDYEYA